jgi:16S rRNA (cytosine967-C5)-methyltransferase
MTIMLPFLDHHLFQILRRFDGQHLPLDLFLSNYFRANKALGSHDRRQIAETVYGMTRWKGLIDHLSGAEKDWEKRHAIFKSLQAEHYLHDESIPLHTRVSLPKSLFDLLSNQYGEAVALSQGQINNTQAPITIRINPAKTTREALLNVWEKEYEVAPCTHSSLGIVFKKRIPFFEMKEFKDGFFEVQDEGSQMVAAMVQPQGGQQVMDYCAGSGGKTLGFAYRMQNKGQIYLHDVRQIALTQAKKRFLRAGIQNAQFLSSDHANLAKLKKKMDWIIVDAPCSGTGTLRRNPDMKWKFHPDMIKNLVSEQRVIFEKALSFLKVGGKIVYATCSMLRAENEDQMHHFMKTYDLEMASEPFSSLPSLGGMDGFFAVTLKRKV